MKWNRFIPLAGLLGLTMATGAVSAEPLVALGNAPVHQFVVKYYAPLVGGVSADGRRLVVTESRGGSDEGVLWVDTQNPIPLADLSSGSTLLRAVAISGDGHTAVGLVAQAMSPIYREGAIWLDSGEVIRMGILPGNVSDAYSGATAVSFDGRVVVGYSSTSDLQGRGVCRDDLDSGDGTGAPSDRSEPAGQK